MIKKTYTIKIAEKIRVNAAAIAGYISAGRTEAQAKEHFRELITESPDDEATCEELFRARILKDDWDMITDKAGDYLLAFNALHFAKEYEKIASKLLSNDINENEANNLIAEIEYHPTFKDLDHAARLAVYDKAWWHVMLDGKLQSSLEVLLGDDDEDNDNE